MTRMFQERSAPKATDTVRRNRRIATRVHFFTDRWRSEVRRSLQPRDRINIGDESVQQTGFSQSQRRLVGVASATEGTDEFYLPAIFSHASPVAPQAEGGCNAGSKGSIESSAAGPPFFNRRLR